MPNFGTIEGRCQCGTVRYTVAAPAEEFYHCHCSICRRLHGATFASYAGVARGAFAIRQGAGNLLRFDSSPDCRRYRCVACGCQLFFDDDRWPHLRFYAPGTADGHPGHPKRLEKHIFVASKLPWYEIADDLPRFDGFPAD
ncbi:MAG: GFA family protein [Proteobacteria bacterium]|nr:GFA family protein [Pseudomonadota bacterium]